MPVRLWFGAEHVGFGTPGLQLNTEANLAATGRGDESNRVREVVRHRLHGVAGSGEPHQLHLRHHAFHQLQLRVGSLPEVVDVTQLPTAEVRLIELKAAVASGIDLLLLRHDFPGADGLKGGPGVQPPIEEKCDREGPLGDRQLQIVPFKGQDSDTIPNKVLSRDRGIQSVVQL